MLQEPPARSSTSSVAQAGTSSRFLVAVTINFFLPRLGDANPIDAMMAKASAAARHQVGQARRKRRTSRSSVSSRSTPRASVLHDAAGKPKKTSLPAQFGKLPRDEPPGRSRQLDPAAPQARERDHQDRAAVDAVRCSFRPSSSDGSSATFSARWPLTSAASSTAASIPWRSWPARCPRSAWASCSSTCSASGSNGSPRWEATTTA